MNHPYEQLSRNLCAAYLAYMQGVSLTTAMKHTPEKLGDYWYLLAERVINEVIGPTHSEYVKRPKDNEPQGGIQ